MARKADIDKLISDLRSILLKYNGIPSVSVDRPSYMKANRIIRLYYDNPEVQELISLFSLHNTQQHRSRGRKIEFQEVISYLRGVFEKYNGIPSQTVDKAAYAKSSRLIKLNKDEPEIIELMQEYDVDLQNKGRNYEEQLSEITSILKSLGRMPKVKDEPELYYKVRYVLQTFKDKEEVIRLKFEYVYGKDTYPIKGTKYPIRPKSYFPFFEDDKEWKRLVSLEYIEYTVRNFGFIPVQDSVPMYRFRKYIDSCSKTMYYNGVESIKSLKTWLQSLYDLNCRDPYILGLLNFFEFCKEETQAKVRDILIENGCCCAGYIWRKLYPGSTMPLNLFNQFYRKYIVVDEDFWKIKPVGRFIRSNNELSPIYVHFKDSHFCNKSLIAKRAEPYKNRDWEEQPPHTLEEWQAYGNLLFFRRNYGGFLDNNQISWNQSVVDYSLKEGIPYFRYWIKYFYLDFFVFLLEHDSPLDEMINDEYTSYKIRETLSFSFSDSRVEELKIRAIALLEEKGIDFMNFH